MKFSAWSSMLVEMSRDNPLQSNVPLLEIFVAPNETSAMLRERRKGKSKVNSRTGISYVDTPSFQGTSTYFDIFRYTCNVTSMLQHFNIPLFQHISIYFNSPVFQYVSILRHSNVDTSHVSRGTSNVRLLREASLSEWVEFSRSDFPKSSRSAG